MSNSHTINNKKSQKSKKRQHSDNNQCCFVYETRFKSLFPLIDQEISISVQEVDKMKKFDFESGLKKAESSIISIYLVNPLIIKILNSRINIFI